MITNAGKSQKTATHSATDRPAQNAGLSAAPPAYGIDAIDRPAQRENRTGLPDKLKAGVEQLSGLSMDDVRVHYNSPKPDQIGALAYTQGTEIHVGPGQEKHLPHEAWHVVQQAHRKAIPSTRLRNGIPVCANESLELEAENMGEQAEAVQRGPTKPIAKNMMEYKATISPNMLGQRESIIQTFSNDSGYAETEIRRILNESQNRNSPYNGALGHPRTHVGRIRKTEQRVLDQNVEVNSTYNSREDQDKAVTEAINSKSVWPRIDDLWIDDKKPNRAIIKRAETISTPVNYVSRSEKRKNEDERGVSIMQKYMSHIFLIVDTDGKGRNEGRIHIQTAFPVD